eukprot:5915426-Amphidinium_carterae.1
MISVWETVRISLQLYLHSGGDAKLVSTPFEVSLKSIGVYSQLHGTQHLGYIMLLLSLLVGLLAGKLRSIAQSDIL